MSSSRRSPKGVSTGRAGERSSRRTHAAASGPAIGPPVVAFVLLLLLAPADSNAFWGVNGFRSLIWPARIALLGVAGACVLLARVGTIRRSIATIAIVALAALLAIGLPEKIHFLGDTSVRIGALASVTLLPESGTLAEWAQRIHAQPLDILVNILLPRGLIRSGMPFEAALACVSFVLALAFLMGAWRLVEQLDPSRRLQLPLFASLVLAGTLEAFAGYIEWAGLVLVAGVWWWREMLRPLTGPRAAFRTAGAWLAIVLCGRIGVVLLLPMAWRCWGPPLEGDRATGRRWLMAASLGGVVLGGTSLFLGSLQETRSAAGELLSSVRAPLTRLARPTDVANLILLTAPLAPMALALAGVGEMSAWRRRPQSGLILSALVALSVLALQMGPSGLGLHRDWDVHVLLGLTLTLGAVTIVATLPEARARAILSGVLPALVLITGGWLAVNASEPVALRRVRTVVAGPPTLPAEQRSSVLLFLASHAATRGNAREAAEYYEQSYDLIPAPNRGLRSAIKWMQAGDPDAARRMIGRLRSRGGLDSTTATTVEALSREIDRFSRGPRPPSPPSH